jgi:hypothetical protein
VAQRCATEEAENMIHTDTGIELEDALALAAVGMWFLVLLAALIFKVRFHWTGGKGGWTTGE